MYTHKTETSFWRKSEKTVYECIDPNLYDPQANMVAFRVTAQRLAFWIRSLQIIYYEHYGKQSQYVVNWYDDPQDWSIKSSGNKAICIEMSTKNPSDITDNSLIYKVTFFLNTGLIQAQGRSYDKFASQDFIILKYLTDKIQKFNTTDEGAPLINEDTCILDKNTSKTGQSSNSDYTPDCDTTFAKQVIENKTKEDNPCNKQYVESIEIDTFAKQVIDNKTKEGNTCSKQYVESTKNETNYDMAVTQYNP